MKISPTDANVHATGAPLRQSLEGTTRPTRRLAIIMMILSSLAISFGGLIVRNIETTSAWDINFYRAVASLGVVLMILLAQYRSNTGSRIAIIGAPGLFAGFVIAGAGLAFVQALTHTTVANTLFILCTIPFMTAILARVFLGERITRPTFVAMLAAATGITLMVVEGIAINSSYGNLMALLTAACFATYTIIVRRNRQVDMLPTLLVSGVIIAAAAVALRGNELFAVSQHDILLCILWGGILSGLANWVFVFAARHIQAAELTLFMLLECALGPLWVWLFLAEAPTFWARIGGFIVIVSVGLRALYELQGARSNPAPAR